MCYIVSRSIIQAADINGRHVMHNRLETLSMSTRSYPPMLFYSNLLYNNFVYIWSIISCKQCTTLIITTDILQELVLLNNTTHAIQYTMQWMYKNEVTGLVRADCYRRSRRGGLVPLIAYRYFNSYPAIFKNNSNYH